MNSGDLIFEEQIAKNPYVFKTWWHYLDLKKDESPSVRHLIYERAVKYLPFSYKIWHAYLIERLHLSRGVHPEHPIYEDTNNTFERALVYLHKMPRIWIMYCEFLSSQEFRITLTRKIFDKCLRALPITQHHRIWPLYINYINHPDIPPETGVRIYRRYLQLDDTKQEDFVEYLKKNQYYDESAKVLADIVSQGKPLPSGRSLHELWADLCELVSNNPDSIKSINFEAVIRSGIQKYSHEVGKLWCSLAEYYTRLGNFEKARDIFEEAIHYVSTVRDFTMVFDAYGQHLETIISLRMSEDDDDEMDLDEEENSLHLDLLLLRLEHLTSSRPLLLNSVLLRQNPYNVNEWLNRTKLLENEKKEPEEILQTFTQAVTSIDPKRCSGPLDLLWINFALFYQKYQDYDNMDNIFKKAVCVHYKHVRDLANVWLSWMEVYLEQQNYQKVLSLIHEVTTPTDNPLNPLFKLINKNIRIWGLYADIEEYIGTVESVSSVYEHIIDLKICTPQTILNYASFLRENKYFRKSFQVYERGVNLFHYPHVFPLWVAYLQHWIQRHTTSNLSQTRQLFMESMVEAKENYLKKLGLFYLDFEAQYGQVRRGLVVLDRLIHQISEKERYDIFTVYLHYTNKHLGSIKCREIFEVGIKVLPETMLSKIIIQYCRLELSLGEVDRCRALYQYGAQFASPVMKKDSWSKFEEEYGNKESYRELLRIKRSISVKFQNDKQDFVPGETIIINPEPDDAFQAVEVASKMNPEEIPLNVDDVIEAENTDMKVEISQKEVPKEVFGALNRFKKQKK